MSDLVSLKGNTDDERVRVLDVANSFAGIDIDAYSSLSDSHGWDLLDAANAGFFGDLSDDLDVSVRPDEDGPGESQSSFEKLVFTPLSSVSDPRKRRRKQSQQTLSIGPDDYEEGPERSAFLFLYERVRACYMKQTPTDVRTSAINWVFTVEDDEEDSNVIGFELCCRALRVRPEIVRLRLQYEFFLKWLVFPRSFSFLTVPVPEILSGEILYRFGEEGYDVARETWGWPGISKAILLHVIGERYDPRVAKQAIERMDEAGIISETGEHYYLTGRNPQLLSRNGALNFRWSQLWGSN